MLSVDSLTDDLLLRIFEFLAEEPRLLAAAEAVSSRWRCVVEVGHGGCWREICLRAWRLKGSQPSLQLPTSATTPAAVSAGWKHVARDIHVRTSRVGTWAHARGAAGADAASSGARLVSAMSETSSGSTFTLPSGLIGDEAGDLVVESNMVHLHDEAPLGDDRVARCEAPYPWIHSPGPGSPLPSLGMPLLERTVAGSNADHILRRRHFHYFEVTIRTRADKRGPAQEPPEARHPDGPCIAVGIATHRFRTNGKQPGWDRYSWGYHGDDGYIYHRSGSGSAWGPAFGAGDVVGCGLDCSLQCIWFTINGCFVGVSHDDQDDLHCGVRYFPVIGVDSRDEVELNTLGPFRFDLDRYQSAKDVAVRSWGRNKQIEAQNRDTCGGLEGFGRRDNNNHSKVAPSAGSQTEISGRATTNSNGNRHTPFHESEAVSTPTTADNMLSCKHAEQMDYVLRALIIWANEERRTLPNAKELPESNYRRMPHSILQNMSQYAAHLPEESLSESDTDNSNVDTDDTNNISDTDSDSFFESDSDASELAPDLHEYLQAIMDAVYDDGSDGDDD